MKRILLLTLSVLLAGVTSVPASAGVNDFIIQSYDIRYELSKDLENRSELLTTETIDAFFPYDDQNHGIERALPKSFDGHKTNIHVESVTKKDGTKWNYETESSNDNLVVRIGDEDTYVSGNQTYIISYTQRDVTHGFENTNSDEFYWDTNGTEWQVPIKNLSVQLDIDDSISGNVTGGFACYQGAVSSSQKCELTKQESSFTTKVGFLAPGENVSIAVGFEQNTFANFKPSLGDTILKYYIASLIVVGFIAILLIIWLLYRWHNMTDRKKDMGTIVPEYVPPRDVSLTAAASLQTNKAALFTAQLLDLAVRHYLKIYQTRTKTLFKAAEYDIEIVKNISDLKAEEREILNDIFSGNAVFGSRLALKSLKNNDLVYKNTQDNDKKLKDLVRGEYALRQKVPKLSESFKKIGKICLVAAVLTLNPVLIVAALTAFICAHTLWPLTDKGLALSRYLEGLKMYIGVAETERLRMLQSPEGAAKAGPVNTSDQGSLVKLYEGVLPFAVLFGQEKQWNKQIGKLYDSLGRSPDWYSGNTAFNAAVFSSNMSGFSSAASYSAASSSSSGGSGGGGFSGGGGGGGGGGGW